MLPGYNEQTYHAWQLALSTASRNKQSIEKLQYHNKHVHMYLKTSLTSIPTSVTGARPVQMVIGLSQ